TPTVAYLSGTLFAGWQQSLTFNGSPTTEIYVARFNGSAWVEAGTGGASGSGGSSTHGASASPKIAAGGGQLLVAWTDSRLANFTGNTTEVYVKKWNGSAFVEELPGDANYRGASQTAIDAQTPALTVDSAGHPFVAWADIGSGSREVLVR